MENPIKPEKEKVLAVEGKDEVNFFKALFEKEQLEGIQIVDIGGSEQFRIKLPLFMQAENFEMVRRIGFVRDAEANTASSAFQSICGILKKCGLPVPVNIGDIIQADAMQVGIHIMPDNASSGMLEDLCLKSVQDSPVYKCVDSFVECFAPTLTAPEKAQFNPSKARAQAFLCTRTPICNSIGLAALKGHVDFSDACFDGIKDFLQRLYR